MIHDTMQDRVDEYVPERGHEEQWDLAGLKNRLLIDFFLQAPDLPDENSVEAVLDWGDREAVVGHVEQRAQAGFKRKLEDFGEYAERILSSIFLYTIDEKWKDHLYDLDQLKAGIFFRAWGQKDPLIEYKKEAYDMFVDLMRDVRSTLTDRIFKAQMAPAPLRAPRITRLSGPTLDTTEEDGRGGPAGRPEFAPTGVAVSAGAGPGPVTEGAATAAGRAAATGMTERIPRAATVWDKVGRNDPCPCGSGKKFKKCHGAPSA
jgi:preprotein translocase subunit SecA